jgi:hypothetical protein
MIDVAVIDQMYEAGRTTGTPLSFLLCDKRWPLPLDQLPVAVKSETGEDVTAADLALKEQAGWYPVVKAADPRADTGVPLYVPSRIGLFLKLEREGFGADELRVAAASEEALIDFVLTEDDLAYVDDDLECLILFAQSRIDALSHGGRTIDGKNVDVSDELALEHRALERFKSLRGKTLTEDGRERITKFAFRARAFNEFTRVMLLNQDRSKLEAGYSPSVVFTSERYSTGESGFIGDGILWEPTIQAAMSHFDGHEQPPIRVPGFVLRGPNVTTSTTLPPQDYRTRWEQHRVDEYLRTWARLHGERRCLHCLQFLPAKADAGRMYCTEKCRNAARQRRFRQQNPGAADRARKRYWDSVAVDDND